MALAMTIFVLNMALIETFILSIEFFYKKFTLDKIIIKVNDLKYKI